MRARLVGGATLLLIGATWLLQPSRQQSPTYPPEPGTTPQPFSPLFVDHTVGKQGSADIVVRDAVGFSSFGARPRTQCLRTWWRATVIPA